jgi:aminoglycoside 3-N-acetyltransferase
MDVLTKFNNELINIGIKKGDKIVLVLDFLKFYLVAKKNKKIVTADDIINILIKAVGETGTIVFNAFCWDFIKKKKFDYKFSKSIGGSLSNRSLERMEFKRTLHPIYSFSVYGKDQNKMCEINEMDSFSNSSTFGYMIKNNFKYLSVGVPLNSGFAFVHVAEQEAKVEYRYKKKFSGTYIDQSGKILKKTCSMFVRNMKVSKGTRSTNLFYNHLVNERIAKKKMFFNIEMNLFDLSDVHDLMLKDLKSNRKFIKSLN